MSQIDIQSNINKSIKTNWYFRTGIVSLLYGISVTITIFLTDGAGGEFIFSNWYQMLTPIPAFIGSQLSGATYIGRQIDAEKEKNKSDLIQKWAIYVGIAIGMMVWGIGFIGTKALDFFSGGISSTCLAIVGATCNLLANISSFAGFCGRLGSTIKLNASFSLTLVKERVPILVGTALGLATSMGLWFLGFAAMTTVLGVTGFMSGGVIPALVGVVFVYRYTSIFTTAFDYCTRVHSYATTYYKSVYSPCPIERMTAKKHMEGKEKQHRGAAIGIAVGLILATVITVALIVTQPYTIVLFAALGVYVTNVGLFGGLFSRIGQVMEGVKRVPAPPSPSDKPEPATVQDAKITQIDDNIFVPSESFVSERLQRRNSISFVEETEEKNQTTDMTAITPSITLTSSEETSPPPSPLSQRDEHSAKILIEIHKKVICEIPEPKQRIQSQPTPISVMG